MSYFKPEEFKCKCGKCDGGVMDNAFIKQLEKARAIANTPFVINSGFRCLAHNKAVGGKAASTHLEGRAADIAFKDSNKAFIILKALMEAGFTSIGYNGAKSFIHVDNRPQMAFFKY